MEEELRVAERRPSTATALLRRPGARSDLGRRRGRGRFGKDGSQREAVAAAFGVVETELDFLEEAFRQRDLFEDLQSQADKSPELLHECAEKDSKITYSTAYMISFFGR
ncbi:hypothetical protein ZWY2020_011010 [Hordeum vulgare]|nr:hypothetical protein ZWY2020_011010 [Hordeum vulgare]